MTIPGPVTLTKDVGPPLVSEPPLLEFPEGKELDKVKDPVASQKKGVYRSKFVLGGLLSFQ